MNMISHINKRDNSVRYGKKSALSNSGCRNSKKVRSALRETNKQICVNRTTDSGLLEKRIYEKYSQLINMAENGFDNKLKDLQVKAILKSKEFEPILNECLKNITSQAKIAENEASIESAFEISLYGLLKNMGITIFPKKEKSIDTVRHISKGRMDSQIGAVVVEYKHRSKLKTKKHIDDATEQISNYLESLKTGEEYCLGVITDGLVIKFITYLKNQIIESSIHEINIKDLMKLIKNIISLETKALTSEKLVEEFCRPLDDNLSKELVRTLYNSLIDSKSKKTHMLNAEWQRLFKLGHDDKSHQQKIEERSEILSTIVGNKKLNIIEQYQVLFCLQTSYAIIVKLIAYKVISDIVFNSPLQSFKALHQSDSENLRIFFKNFEDGSTLKEIGLDNLLEGDFFSWYCSKEQWNSDIYLILKNIIQILADYEEKEDIFQKGKLNDLFRDLYQNIMPDVVRYSLGEFYTPKWLAQHIVNHCVGKKENWKGLDPCAGSGTFIIAMIEKVLNENNNSDSSKKISEVLNRVKAIDLNPLAVLTARVNYFIAISPYLPDEFSYIEIPVYLGDSAYIPKTKIIEGVRCLEYSIDTKIEPIKVILPISVFKNSENFSQTIHLTEKHITHKNEDEAFKQILDLIPKKEQKLKITKNIKKMVSVLINLENNSWDRIWLRIIKNFIKTGTLGYFDVIVGNPPWIDWKNLPAGYRQKLVNLCVDRGLFSGDGLTGGINLNICALITNVVAENYLSKNGRFGFLMPKSILFQQTYEGFRKLITERDKQLIFKNIDDWSKAGNPFYPVTQKFLTYYFEFNEDYRKIVPVTHYIQKPRANIKDKQQYAYEEIRDFFETNIEFAVQLQEEITIFTFIKDKNSIDFLKKIAGVSEYKGREGIEFYPQEIMIFREDKSKTRAGKGVVWVENFQTKKSKYKIPKKSFRIETKYLHPLIKGVDISTFNLDESALMVPFPYEKENPRTPVSIEQLRETSPLLLKHFEMHKQIIINQNEYNEKIKGKYGGVFYSVARVGNYSVAPFKVAFRDNTKWGAVVVSQKKKFVGENKIYLLQNHAPAISEKPDGTFISEDEAHYICAILNAPICEKYILHSSDSRTFKINPPIKIPVFDKKNSKHIQLCELSKKAHGDKKNIKQYREQIEKIYISILL